MKLSEKKIQEYLDLWMSEDGFEQLLMEQTTVVEDVFHIINPNGKHQITVTCKKGLVLLFPPAN